MFAYQVELMGQMTYRFSGARSTNRSHSSKSFKPKGGRCLRSRISSSGMWKCGVIPQDGTLGCGGGGWASLWGRERRAFGWSRVVFGAGGEDLLADGGRGREDMKGGEHTEERKREGEEGSQRARRGDAPPTVYYMDPSIHRHVRGVALQFFSSCHTSAGALVRATVLNICLPAHKLPRRRPPPPPPPRRRCRGVRFSLSFAGCIALMNAEASWNAKAAIRGRNGQAPYRGDSIGRSRGDLRLPPMPPSSVSRRSLLVRSAAMNEAACEFAVFCS